jgi:hypothetical protein
MSDTNHSHSDIPIEGDGISYSGIGWFIVVLVVTVVASELFVVGLFKATERYRLNRPEVVRAPLAAPVSHPTIDGGRLETGMEAAAAPTPTLLVDEPINLKAFRDNEQKMLHTYGWVNEGAQTVRLTIDRAKDLVIERKLLPAREAPAGTAAAEPVVTTPAAPATHEHAPAPAGH